MTQSFGPWTSEMTIPNATQADLATHWKRRVIMLSRMRFCRSGVLPWTVLLVLFFGIFGLPEFRATKTVNGQSKKPDPNAKQPAQLASNPNKGNKANSLERRLSLLEQQLAEIRKLLLLQQRRSNARAERAPGQTARNPLQRELTEPRAPQPRPKPRSPQLNPFADQLPKARRKKLAPPEVQALPPIRPVFPSASPNNRRATKLVSRVYPISHKEVTLLLQLMKIREPKLGINAALRKVGNKTHVKATVAVHQRLARMSQALLKSTRNSGVFRQPVSPDSNPSLPFDGVFESNVRSKKESRKKKVVTINGRTMEHSGNVFVITQYDKKGRILWKHKLAGVGPIEVKEAGKSGQIRVRDTKSGKVSVLDVKTGKLLSETKEGPQPRGTALR